MRIIKFRAWDRKEKEMLYSDPELSMGFNIFTGGWIGEKGDYELPHIVLMQFTGLKDKNGKEIYEGDIVRVYIPNYTGEYIMATIEFCSGCFGIRVAGNPILNNAVGQFKAFNENTEGIEVIGNVYENPELLK